jgi:hypothetical protein
VAQPRNQKLELGRPHCQLALPIIESYNDTTMTNI